MLLPLKSIRHKFTIDAPERFTRRTIMVFPSPHAFTSSETWVVSCRTVVSWPSKVTAFKSPDCGNNNFPSAVHPQRHKLACDDNDTVFICEGASAGATAS